MEFQARARLSSDATVAWLEDLPDDEREYLLAWVQNDIMPAMTTLVDSSVTAMITLANNLMAQMQDVYDALTPTLQAFADGMAKFWEACKATGMVYSVNFDTEPKRYRPAKRLNRAT